MKLLILFILVLIIQNSFAESSIYDNKDCLNCINARNKVGKGSLYLSSAYCGNWYDLSPNGDVDYGVICNDDIERYNSPGSEYLLGPNNYQGGASDYYAYIDSFTSINPISIPKNSSGTFTIENKGYNSDAISFSNIYTNNVDTNIFIKKSDTEFKYYGEISDLNVGYLDVAYLVVTPNSDIDGDFSAQVQSKYYGSRDNDLPPWAISLICIGVIIGVILIGCGCVCRRRMKRKRLERMYRNNLLSDKGNTPVIQTTVVTQVQSPAPSNQAYQQPNNYLPQPQPYGIPQGQPTPEIQPTYPVASPNIDPDAHLPLLNMEGPINQSEGSGNDTYVTYPIAK